jgi:hypothetical protein
MYNCIFFLISYYKKTNTCGKNLKIWLAGPGASAPLSN